MWCGVESSVIRSRRIGADDDHKNDSSALGYFTDCSS